MSVPVLSAYNNNGRKEHCQGQSLPVSERLSFAHYLDINLEQSSTVVSTNCEKWLAIWMD
jgi:hypothetical protein